jgi:hypothetical protein
MPSRIPNNYTKATVKNLLENDGKYVMLYYIKDSVTLVYGGQIKVLSRKHPYKSLKKDDIVLLCEDSRYSNKDVILVNESKLVYPIYFKLVEKETIFPNTPK